MMDVAVDWADEVDQAEIAIVTMLDQSNNVVDHHARTMAKMANNVNNASHANNVNLVNHVNRVNLARFAANHVAMDNNANDDNVGHDSNALTDKMRQRSMMKRISHLSVEIAYRAREMKK
jgi:hypothetical protein